jgi:predicted transcriptional regulator
MATTTVNPKQQAHELIDRLTAGQVAAVVGLLEAMLDPVSVALANAPIEDEPIGEEEERAVAASKAWLAEHPGEGIPHEEVMAEFGLSSEDPVG